MSILKRVARTAVEMSGYYLHNYGVLPYGIEYLYDIQRLSTAWKTPVKTFFDIGAHWGETTEGALKAFPTARVFSFEPHPKNFTRLRSTFAGESRVSLHEIAIDREQRTGTLFKYSQSEISSLSPDARYAVAYSKQQTGTLMVSCHTLDDFCQQLAIPSIDVLKIDTEGNELNVLIGGARLLKQGAIRFVYLEFNDLVDRPNRNGGALMPIAEALCPLGFRFVATYTDYVGTDGGTFVVSNVLLALPPDRVTEALPVRSC
jgi:FkbM family methyltransferase